MPAIGPPLRPWTLLLLVCSIPSPWAFAQAANETTTTVSPRTTASSSPTTPALALAATLTRRYSETVSTCPFRTINYITHTLPQQCAKTSWSAPDGASSAVAPAADTAPTYDPGPSAATASGDEATHGPVPEAGDTGADGLPPEVTTTVIADDTGAAAVSTDLDGELETDSPFDNANFLSFEEWKNRNLAQAGQSPENVGQGRAAPSNQAGRRRPVNVNALDSLGDEGEIEIDFSGFGPPPDRGHIVSQPQAESGDRSASKAAGEDGKMAPSSWALSKDAGKTCKERFNYASFDCAATVLKANKQAKSSTSVLVENKDSYMLNECSADNKFLIVELCDDILVDTVVLANYEFFSSMFRHFRVSVSDRYPVKMERWRTLGTFEARNTREIQPFLITEPQIWARYIRVEFLTQFGNEFYCPLSLLRVHGTTMMEQFRREEEEARGLDDEEGDLEAEAGDVVKPASDSGPLPPDQLPVQLISKEQSEAASMVSNAGTEASSQNVHDGVEKTKDEQGTVTSTVTEPSSASSRLNFPPATTSSTTASHSLGKRSPVTSESTIRDDLNHTASEVIEDHAPSSSTYNAQPTSQGQASIYPVSSSSPTDSPIGNASKTSIASSSSTNTIPKAVNNHTGTHAQAQSTRGSSTQPTPPAPSTQESFYKSIHKRLLYLEANSTLSLQYIEEQSRILRDAFMKVEKRQLAKTEKFLNHLNSTVMQELKSYRNMYDQLWQSTIIELESMKERQNAEIGEIGTRLSIMADELVWQKRMAVVQSTLLLLCLGLVLFVRSGTLSSPSDAPIVQQLGSFFESSPPRSPQTPGLARRRRTFRNMWRSDTSVGMSDHPSDGHHIPSDGETDLALQQQQQHMERTPPTPDTPYIDPPTPTADDQAARIQVLETQSGPATPNGTRDSRPSWEEVDRAIDQLKAEEQGAGGGGTLHPTSTKRDRDRKKKRSPLRRAHSSYDGVADESPSEDEEIDVLDP